MRQARALADAVPELAALDKMQQVAILVLMLHSETRRMRGVPDRTKVKQSCWASGLG